MSKKQTSIEWLRNELWKQFNFAFSDNIFEQAKAMHKYEIMEAYDDGWHQNNDEKYNPIRYYTDTYGKE